MLGLLLIYFIGKYFYQLAEDNNRNKWLYAILGVIVYYVGMIVLTVVFGVIMSFTIYPYFFDMEDILLTLIAIPFGLLSVWIFYSILRKVWRSKPVLKKTDGLIDDF